MHEITLITILFVSMCIWLPYSIEEGRHTHTYKHTYTHIQTHIWVLCVFVCVCTHTNTHTCTYAHISSEHTYLQPYTKMAGKGLFFPVLERVGLEVG